MCRTNSAIDGHAHPRLIAWVCSPWLPRCDQPPPPPQKFIYVFFSSRSLPFGSSVLNINFLSVSMSGSYGGSKLNRKFFCILFRSVPVPHLSQRPLKTDAWTWPRSDDWERLDDQERRRHRHCAPDRRQGQRSGGPSQEALICRCGARQQCCRIGPRTSPRPRASPARLRWWKRPSGPCCAITSSLPDISRPCGCTNHRGSHRRNQQKARRWQNPRRSRKSPRSRPPSVNTR